MHDVAQFGLNPKTFEDGARVISRIAQHQHCDSKPAAQCSHLIHALGSEYSTFMQRTTPRMRDTLRAAVVLAFGLDTQPTDGQTHERLRTLRKKLLQVGNVKPEERDQALKFCQYIAER